MIRKQVKYIQYDHDSLTIISAKRALYMSRCNCHTLIHMQ